MLERGQEPASETADWPARPPVPRVYWLVQTTTAPRQARPPTIPETKLLFCSLFAPSLPGRSVGVQLSQQTAASCSYTRPYLRAGTTSGSVRCGRETTLSVAAAHAAPGQPQPPSCLFGRSWWMSSAPQHPLTKHVLPVFQRALAALPRWLVYCRSGAWCWLKSSRRLFQFQPPRPRRDWWGRNSFTLATPISLFAL
jgi:hypothetical protein